MIWALLAAAAAPGYYQSSPERHTVAERITNHWEAEYRAKLIPSLMQDFGEKYLYAPADQALPPPRRGEQRVVFLGDSITDLWDLTKSFPGKPYVNRGIGGQVTAQLVVRFHQDVVDLHPAAVVVLAGINDVQGGLQRESDAGIEANWEAMADIADAHRIRIIFGAMLPVTGNVVAERDPKRIRALNAWLAAFCKRRGYGLADYYKATVDRDGLLEAGLTRDGLHPLANGYARMAPVAEAAIERAIGRKVKAAP